jgi:phosphoserine phosphatase
MTTKNWQNDIPIDAFVFDCDGTLSKIEGIDELARSNGVGELVEALTANAMSKLGISEELYHARLHLVQPKLEQVISVGQEYFQQRTPHISDVIQLLQRLNKHVYIVSAGLFQSVEYFGELLQVPRKNIYAVNAHFDADRKYVDFDRTSPLIKSAGKRDIITELKKRHPRIVHVGDGLNDYVVYDLVTRFIGFGGVFYRENIAQGCEYYIKATSMAPLLPLTLTNDECEALTFEERELYHQGLTAIHNQQVLIKQDLASALGSQ